MINDKGKNTLCSCSSAMNSLSAGLGYVERERPTFRTTGTIINMKLVTELMARSHLMPSINWTHVCLTDRIQSQSDFWLPRHHSTTLSSATDQIWCVTDFRTKLKGPDKRTHGTILSPLPLPQPQPPPLPFGGDQNAQGFMSAFKFKARHKAM